MWFFLDFPGKLPLCHKTEQLGSYSLFDPLDQANFMLNLTCVIKVDKRKILCPHFEHTYVLLLFLFFFQENHNYAIKVNNFASYPLFDPLNQANSIYFGICHQKLLQEKYFGYILSIFMCSHCFQFFQEITLLW